MIKVPGVYKRVLECCHIHPVASDHCPYHLPRDLYVYEIDNIMRVIVLFVIKVSVKQELVIAA